MAVITIHAYRRYGEEPAEIATVDDADLDEVNRVASVLMRRDIPGGLPRSLQVWLGGRDPESGAPDLEVGESGDMNRPLEST